MTALLLVFSAAALSAMSKDGESPWRRMDDSLVTPHRQFSKPVAGKKLTAMVLASGIAQREIVELKQRFDYNYVHFPVLSRSKFSPFTKPGKPVSAAVEGKVYGNLMNKDEYKAEVARIMAELPKCDIIMLAKMNWNLVPTDIQASFLNRVKAGASMILITYDGTTQTVPGLKFAPEKINFPVNAIPAFKNLKIAVASHGKGKVMRIDYDGEKMKKRMIENGYVDGLVPFEADDPLYYDYYLAFIGKCMWKLAEPDRETIASVTPAGKITLKKNAPAGSRIRWEIADAFGEVLFKGQVTAAKNISLKLPAYSASARMLDVKLVNAKGAVIDYLSAPLKKADVIEKIALKKDGFKPDEPIPGKIQFAAPATGTLQISMIDGYGKVIYLTKQSIAKKKEVSFRADILHQNSHYAVISAQLRKNGSLIDEKREYVYFNTINDISDFAFGMWGYSIAKSRVTQLWNSEMKRWGVDNIMDSAMLFAPQKSFFTPRALKRINVNYAIYCDRLVGSSHIKYFKQCPYEAWHTYKKTGSFYGPDGKVLDRNDQLFKFAKGGKDVGVLFYNIGDENAAADHANVTKENCFCDKCQVRFRNYLKREYKTLAAVNKCYGTKYKTFHEIKGLPFAKSVEKGQYSMWLDYRLFMEEEFINWHRFVKAKIQSVDPEARVGIEGMAYPASSFSAFNLYKMMPHFDFCAPYHHPRETKAVIQYLPQKSKIGVFKSAWFGSYEGEMTEQFVMMPPWRYLFAGLRGAFYWYAGNPNTAGSFSTACVAGPDLRMLSQFTGSAKEIRKIKESGIGKLFLNSKQNYSGVLIHYSNNCLHASTLYPDKSSWEISHDDLQGLLNSLGIGSRFISPPELEKGIPGDAKVLFLPYSQAMSAKEVAAVKAFAKRGGMVIADYNPAICDEHGKLRSESALKDVFGEFKRLNIKRYGKGYGVVLDDYISGINARILRREASGIQNGILRLIAKVGVRPFADVRDGDGIIQEYATFVSGKSHYLGLLGQRSQAGQKRQGPVGAEGAASTASSLGGSFRRTIKLAKPMHVYDIIRNNKYLGKVKEFTVELEPATGRVFACLETPAKRPAVKVSARQVKPGKAICFNVSGRDNTAILTITGPDGKVINEQRITANKARFIPAFNDPKGTYKVQIKNVVGGLSSGTTFQVVK